MSSGCFTIELGHKFRFDPPKYIGIGGGRCLRFLTTFPTLTFHPFSHPHGPDASIHPLSRDQPVWQFNLIARAPFLYRIKSDVWYGGRWETNYEPAIRENPNPLQINEKIHRKKSYIQICILARTPDGFLFFFFFC